MIEHRSKMPVPARLLTGVPGLDVILGGGLFRGGVYMVIGSPGVGKTILGNQLCYRHVAQGGRAIYLTLLSESHARLISHQSALEFFDGQCIGVSLFYISGYEALAKEKLKGLLDLVRSLVREHKANLLVIDGLVTAGAMAQDDIELKKFIHELQVFVELVDCTTVLLTGANASEDQYPMRTMVDGLIRLRLEPAGMSSVRTLEVMKFRGGANLLGLHFFEISSAGITVHPRIEALLGRSPQGSQELGSPLPFGVDSLDRMLGGGLRPASITMVLGSPGSGKTLLGLSFLGAGARAKEPGLYFGFFETPAELARKGQEISADFARNHQTGMIELMWQPPLETLADALAERILAAVKKRGVRRLFIDGLGGLKDGLIYPERLGPFLSALSNELRSLGVAVILSDETPRFVGPESKRRSAA